MQRDHVVRELCGLDTERRRLKSLEGRMSMSGSKKARASKSGGTSSKSRKRVEKVRRIEVTFVDDTGEGSGGDTDRII